MEALRISDNWLSDEEPTDAFSSAKAIGTREGKLCLKQNERRNVRCFVHSGCCVVNEAEASVSGFELRVGLGTATAPPSG